MDEHKTQPSLTTFLGHQMAEIPKGKIELRDDRTKQKWTVEIEPFLLAKFPVTQDLYFEVIQENPSTYKGEKHPVETVTWKEAVVFCNVLSLMSGLTPCYLIPEVSEEITFNKSSNGFRLPTEAEWEYACKAGS